LHLATPRAVALIHVGAVGAEAFATSPEPLDAAVVIRVDITGRSIVREPDRADEQRATERCGDQDLS
jgi:hypothetical protein